MVNVLAAFLAGLALGTLMGFARGIKSGAKGFYKHPSSHWRIRRR